MSAEVLTKDLRERAVPVAALSVGVGLLTDRRPRASTRACRGTLDDLTKDFPEELMAFMGGDAPGGYVVGEVFNLIAPLALVAYAVMTGASATAGEEERKTMGMVMGTPVSRTSMLVAKAGGLVVSLARGHGLFLLAAVGRLDRGSTSVCRPATSSPPCSTWAPWPCSSARVAMAVGAATGKPGSGGRGRRRSGGRCPTWPRACCRWPTWTGGRS